MHHVRALSNQMFKIWKGITDENYSRPRGKLVEMIPEMLELSNRTACFRYIRHIACGRYLGLGTLQDHLFHLRFYIKKHRLSNDIIAEAWNLTCVSKVMSE